MRHLAQLLAQLHRRLHQAATPGKPCKDRSVRHKTSMPGWCSFMWFVVGNSAALHFPCLQAHLMSRLALTSADWQQEWDHEANAHLTITPHSS